MNEEEHPLELAITQEEAKPNPAIAIVLGFIMVTCIAYIRRH